MPRSALSAPSLLVSPSGRQGGATSAICTWDRVSAAWSPRRWPGLRTRAPPTTWSRTKARLARRPNRPMQSGSLQPVGRGTAAAGSSGSAEGDLVGLGRPLAAQAMTTSRREGLARRPPTVDGLVVHGATHEWGGEPATLDMTLRTRGGWEGCGTHLSAREDVVLPAEPHAEQTKGRRRCPHGLFGVEIVAFRHLQRGKMPATMSAAELLLVSEE
jgi:hypothetical protein